MVKNENELLGILINIQKEYGKIDNNKLPQITNTDSVTLDFLLKKLKEKYYIIYTFETTNVTDLGIANYISKAKYFALWIAKLLIITIKEIFVFFSGVASGVLVAYLVWKFGWL